MELQPDSLTKDFSLGVFTYLRYKEGYATINAAGLAAFPMPVLIPAVAKVVTVLSKFSVGFFEICKLYFKKYDMNRRNVLTFIAKRCFNFAAISDDIFYVILNACTFVHCLAMFCQKKNWSDLILLAPMCLSEIFVYAFEEKFYAKGGWGEFQNYVINHCYLSKFNTDKLQLFIRSYKVADSFFSKVENFRLHKSSEQSEMQQQNQMQMETSDEETGRNPRDNPDQETDSSSETEDCFMEELNRFGFSSHQIPLKMDSEASSELRKKLIRRTLKAIKKIVPLSDIVEGTSPQETGENPVDDSESDDNSDSDWDFSEEMEEIRRFDLDNLHISEFGSVLNVYKKIIGKCMNTIRKNYHLPLSEYGKTIRFQSLKSIPHYVFL